MIIKLSNIYIKYNLYYNVHQKLKPNVIITLIARYFDKKKKKYGLK